MAFAFKLTNLGIIKSIDKSCPRTKISFFVITTNKIIYSNYFMINNIIIVILYLITVIYMKYIIYNYIQMLFKILVNLNIITLVT